MDTLFIIGTFVVVAGGWIYYQYRKFRIELSVVENHSPQKKTVTVVRVYRYPGSEQATHRFSGTGENQEIAEFYAMEKAKYFGFSEEDSFIKQSIY